ncbi:hypothetical protein DPEC_G00224890 [Dallia pectoralis]|uniref:Uncharacterized protein n=1 Tax=Dallia pectoralis TaxID=75939 RepID=A0ACC2G086_DALPE|nr:hypothetical protein DPEC_G00224890 [Dallia pectoralis]
MSLCSLGSPNRGVGFGKAAHITAAVYKLFTKPNQQALKEVIVWSEPQSLLSSVPITTLVTLALLQSTVAACNLRGDLFSRSKPEWRGPVVRVHWEKRAVGKCSRLEYQ